MLAAKRSYFTDPLTIDLDVCLYTFNTPLPALAQQKETPVFICGNQVKPCLFQPENRCHANRKDLFVVKLYEMCMHMCPGKLHVSPTRSHSPTQSVVFSIPAYIFCLFNVPVRLAICSEVWNCSKQGFTVCPHWLSAAGAQIFLISHTGLLSFCWYDIQMRHFNYLTLKMVF